MLPRANKNIVKVNINKDDDQEEIEAKKEAARRNFQANQQKKRSEWNNEMDVEPPTINRRKTDVYNPSEFTAKHSAETQRRSMAPKLGLEPQDENNPRQKHINLPIRSAK